MLQQCTTDEECGEGRVCGGDTAGAGFNCFGSYCGSACTPDSCAAGTQCLPNGHCAALPCTDPEFVGCPDLWYCDAAAAQSGDTSGGLQIDGSTSTSQPIGVLESGCRQLRCDEAGGPACIDGWECNTAAAAEQSVGCAALACEDIGHCSNDDVYICEPTSSNTRYDSVDAHGCVQKNCEEGYPCTEYQVCDYSRPDADVVGCSFVQCTEPGGVCPGSSSTVCDPGSTYANVYGCRLPNCNDDYTCPMGSTCDPASEAANARGCVTDATDVSMKPPPPNDLIAAGGVGTGAGGQGQMPNPTAGATQVPSGGASPEGSSGSSSAGATADPVPVRPTGAAEGAACTVDVDCREGYCVLGACRPRLGVCSGG